MSYDLAIPREDTVRREVPRLPDDYSTAAARWRMAFLAAETGTRPEHIGRYSFDPAVLAGNIENFTGVAQVPIGIAGPLLIDGEHARGTFYVPLATTEGTLVASYNRGMKLIHQAGGVRTTVMADVMQRAPAFGFDSARQARAFGDWVTEQLRGHQARGGGHHPDGPAARHRAVLGEQVHVPAVQLHHRRRRGTEPHRQGDPARVRLDPGAVRRGSRTSAWRPTWPRTRRARTSTSCAPGASGSPPKPSSRPPWPRR